MKYLQLGKRLQAKSRRGSMLIMVLMIFAITLILISSALTVTLAGRSRYYVDMEKSQERLTLSCAAEAILDAINAQELTDAELLTMVNNGEYEITGASSYGIGSYLSEGDSGLSIAPGLMKDSTSVSRTYFTVTTAPTTQIEELNPDHVPDIVLSFHTLINVTGEDSKAESLRVHLMYKKPVKPPKICNNMVTCGQDGSENEFSRFEFSCNDPSAYAVFHGTTYLAAGGGGANYYCRTIFTGRLIGGQGQQYYNDVIFYGPDAGLAVSGNYSVHYSYGDWNGNVTWGNGLQTTGDIYFIGNNDGDCKCFYDTSGNVVSIGSGGWMNMSANGIYMYKASGSATNGNMTVDTIVVADGATYSGSGNNVVIDGGSASGSFTTKSPTDAAVSSDYNRMKVVADAFIDEDDDNTTALEKAAETQVADAADYQAAYADLTTGYTSLKMEDYTGRIKPLNASGQYEMHGTYQNGRLEVNLTDDASIYMSGDVTFASYTIVVSNATDYKLTIVLAPGVQFYVRARPGDDYDVCQNVGGQATTGIISCDDRNADGSAVAGSQEPACNIVGLGSNYFHASGQATVDAYISLAGRGTEKSTIRFLDAPKFYGRVEAVNIATTYAGQPAQGNAIKMDFCPAPGEGSGSSLKPLSTNYRRGSFEYYYE